MSYILMGLRFGCIYDVILACVRHLDEIEVQKFRCNHIMKKIPAFILIYIFNL